MGFEAYTKSSLVAGKRMLRQLSLLALVLFDVHALEDKYGLKPTHWPDRMVQNSQFQSYTSNVDRNPKISRDLNLKRASFSRSKPKVGFSNVAN